VSNPHVAIAHVAFETCWAMHAWPHPPQFAALALVSTHCELQHAATPPSPALHECPHIPQCAALDVVSTHA